MKNKVEAIQIIQQKFETLSFCLDERARRLWAATEALSYGRGGITIVSQATGLSNRTIHTGIKELKNKDHLNEDAIRKKGGGRKKVTEKYPTILTVLEKLIDPVTRGDPESPLRWTSKSTAKLTDELNNKNFLISARTTAALLKVLDYSLQSNSKVKEGSSHVDRDEQFNFVSKKVSALQKKKQPTISVDTKKKENIGEFKNRGQELCKKGQPIKVKTHDFPDKKLGKVAPYGVYDIGKNKGWVSVGISADTAEFAVNTIRTWWYKMGKAMYQNASELMITADCGGSNGYRVRLWKIELQKLANETGLQIHVSHFPPGTSKWNKIEHRMFSYISKNWRGKPLISREVVVNLIGNTRTTKGLEICAVIDENEYKKGKKITDKEVAQLNIKCEDFHPEWNYTISSKVSGEIV